MVLTVRHSATHAKARQECISAGRFSSTTRKRCHHNFLQGHLLTAVQHAAMETIRLRKAGGAVRLQTSSRIILQVMETLLQETGDDCTRAL